MKNNIPTYDQLAPIPPVDWLAVYIGTIGGVGIYIEMPNPELNCEVIF